MSAGRSTWDLSEFHGGIDLRDGLFSGNQTRFRELVNVWIDKGRKLRRRPPCLRTEGDLDSKTQGLVSIDGKLYTFAKKGDVVAHTGSVAGVVETLFFDNPDKCSTWELLAAGVFDGYAVAWIKHGYPSQTYPFLTFLHVWDGLVFAPTFVQDPYLPGSFSPSIGDLTEQVYDSGFRPVLGQGATKLWTSTLRGNAQACRTADTRVWNQRTKDSLLTDGEHWCFVVPEGAGGIHEYLVPRDASWMTGEGRWTYYVLEYGVDGVWEPLTEVLAESLADAFDGAWCWESVPSRWTGGWNELRIRVRWPLARAGLIRLRMVAGATAVDPVEPPSVTAIAGSGSSWRLRVGDGRYTYRGGDGVEAAGYDTADLLPGKTYLLALSADAGRYPTLLDLADGWPDGAGREARHFFKRIETTTEATGSTEWDGTWAPTWVAMTGTVDIAASNVTGTGTSFLAEMVVGDRIRVAGDERVVATITDDLTATVATAWGAIPPGQIIEKGYAYALYSGGKTIVRVTSALAAEVVVGNTLRIGGTAYKVSAVAGQYLTITDATGANGDFTAVVGKLQQVYKTSEPTISDYQYAFQSNTESRWYTERVVEYVDQAGAEDALAISTAAHDNTGGVITSIATVRQRMVVSYPGSIQLWSIDQDTNRTAYLDQLSFGTGDQEHPSPTVWYSAVILPMETGFRAIDAVGANLNNLQDLNIGEPISAMEMVGVRSASFWPWFGQFIVAGRRGETLEFLCLDYSRESKITAWSQWTVAGLADVDHGTLIPMGSSLWFRSGTKLLRFDAAAVTFRDFADPREAPFESLALFHYNDLGKPGTDKRIVGMDVVQDGECSVWFESLGAGTLRGPTVSGTTAGRARFPLAIKAQALAVRLSTRSEAAWRLQRLSLDFLLLRR